MQVAACIISTHLQIPNCSTVLFLETMRQLYIMEPTCKFIVACANAQRRAQLERQLAHFDMRLPIQYALLFPHRGKNEWPFRPYMIT